MTAVCISSTRGVLEYQSASYTIATTAPTTNFDLEVRYNLLDANSVPLTKKDLVRFLEAVIDGIESGENFFGTAVNGTNFTGPQI